ADFLDLGGESSRPGADPVSAEEEIRRLLPVLKKIKKHFSELPISIDTFKSKTAEVCLSEGADLVNDISAGEASGGAMFAICRKFDVPIVLMHKQGESKTMQDRPEYEDVVSEVALYLSERAKFALGHGIGGDQCVLDPGIGFGKNKEHNLALLKNIFVFRKLGFPVLIGASMKRIVGDLTGRPTEGRLPGSLGIHLAAVMNGASILRVHDVGAMKDALTGFFGALGPSLRFPEAEG
ncbi:MAG: dihydropteroate synthase, partial [Spirochaetia bacterium]|nr:dihydropteroate synthase [Spirochaetia bacterium]